MDDIELRKLAVEATQGSWEASETHCDAVVTLDYKDIDPDHFDYYHGLLICESAKSADVDFIAAASPTTVLALLDRLAARAESIASLQARLQDARSYNEKLLSDGVKTIRALQERNAKLEAALKEITETNCFQRSNKLGECAKAIARKALAEAAK